MTRVTPRLPRTTGAVQCSRCLDVVDVRAGHWIAGEHDGPAAVCARCAALDDPGGWAQVLAWRRAARPAGSSSSTGSSSRDPWAA